MVFMLLSLYVFVCMITGFFSNSFPRSDHAWNQVKLDGDWYAVDLTWDDPMGSYEDIPAAGEPGHHRYFNVTGGFLLESDHQWDYDAVPEAEGTRYAWPG